MIPNEFTSDFRSLKDYMDFRADNPWFVDQAAIGNWVSQVALLPVLEPLTWRVISTKEMNIVGDNYRETLESGGLGSRHRAMLSVIESFVPKFHKPRQEIDVYMPESVTQFANLMRRHFRFEGSEYADSPKAKTSLALSGIRTEDYMSLTFEDESFDMVCSNDVLEHVPSIDACLRETIRVLRPGGVMIATHPFYDSSDTPVVRAEIVNGELVHHAEPEYHGNPVDPKGSLVFEVPGWDIVPRCMAAGASDAFVRITGSKKHGFIGAHNAGIFLTVCIK